MGYRAVGGHLVVLLHIARCLRLFRHVKQLRFIAELTVRLAPTYWRMGMLLVLIFYIFDTIGVQVFGGLIYKGNPALKGSTFEAGDHPAAKGMLEKLFKEYPGTAAQRMSYDLMGMLSIVGRPVPEDWESGIEQWFTDKPDIQIDEGVVLVIFWEVWCPHCTRELPGWQQRYKALASQGLKLLAVTDITRDATPDQVAAFVKLHELTFPIAKGDGTLSAASAVRSIPDATVYRDGVVIFRGSPSLITDAMLSEWLHSP
jgi:hypothetical protein